MITLGLTGGIGSGKSTVAGLFAAHGAVVCDADALGHEILEPDRPGFAPVVAAFGSTILDAAGRIDRAWLGPLVFADPAARRRLEAITHPLIAARLAEETRRAREAGAPVFVAEAALLVESGLYRAFDVVVVVRAEARQARERVMDRDGSSAADVAARQRAQADAATREAVADHVIDNRGSLEDTARQVARIWRALATDPTG